MMRVLFQLQALVRIQPQFTINNPEEMATVQQTVILCRDFLSSQAHTYTGCIQKVDKSKIVTKAS